MTLQTPFDAAHQELSAVVLLIAAELATKIWRLDITLCRTVAVGTLCSVKNSTVFSD